MTVPDYVFAEEGDLIITACPEETLGGCAKGECHCTSSKRGLRHYFVFQFILCWGFLVSAVE